jgi:hypothetical protein
MQLRYASFVPKAVRQMYLEDITLKTFQEELLQAETPTPVHLIPKTPDYERIDIIDILLKDPASQTCVVDLEIGRYDQDVEKVQLPLAFYLEWLRDGREQGKMKGKQVYLAQWRGLEDVGIRIPLCKGRADKLLRYPHFKIS